MKKLELRKLIREEIRKVLKEGVSAEEMKNGIRLDSDNGKMAGSVVRIATTMGFKQGTWNNGTANGDYSFDYDDGDASNSSELVDDSGENSKGYSPSKIFILNPKMQNHPTMQSLMQKAIEWYG
jgi:hypothetical protein